MFGSLVFALLLGAGCRPKSESEVACLKNDPRPSFCYVQARMEGYDHGLARGYDDGWQAGYDQCQADHDTGNGGDTGDTGDTGVAGAR